MVGQYFPYLSVESKIKYDINLGNLNTLKRVFTIPILLVLDLFTIRIHVYVIFFTKYNSIVLYVFVFLMCEVFLVYQYSPCMYDISVPCTIPIPDRSIDFKLLFNINKFYFWFTGKSEKRTILSVSSDLW